jgi:hypothetical protein
MSKLLTRGEQLVGHPLMAERVAGVPHYVPGQHQVAITSPAVLREMGIDDGVEHPAAEITYVDQMGEAVMVLASKDDDGWEPVIVGRAGHQVFRGWRVVGVDGFEFVLSEKMLAALERAEQEMAT